MKVLRKSNLPILYVAFCLSSQSRADETTTSALEWNNTWSSPYTRALGGSQTAHALNEDALYANPAALNKTRHPRSRAAIDSIEGPGLSLGGNRTTMSTLKGKTLKPSEWLQSFGSQSVTERNYLETQMFPWLAMGERGGPTFFLGLPLRSYLVANPAQEDGLSRTVMTETTATAAMNMSISSRSGAVALGLSLRPNLRWSSLATHSLADMISSKGLFGALKSEQHKTSATSVDAGFIATAGDFWLPSFGLSILNIPTGCVDNFVNPATGKNQSICGTKRTGDVNEELPGTQLDPTEVRLGVSIVPRIRIASQRVNLKISGDIYPLPITYGGKNYGFRDVNINQLTHAGVEIFLGSANNNHSLSLRAGLNDTRTSWGISLPLPNFSLDFSSYEAAIFTDGRVTKDRRYLLGMSGHW
ncbi:MAG: hypothetical protein ACO3A4_05310 [Silvanigrellaceae bacterium]